MLRIHKILVLAVLLGSLFGCALVPDPRPSDRVVIAAWNVQNLFDEVDDGDEYDEFDPEQGWSRAQFWARCSALASVIRSLGDGGPDVLVLEEVEGAHALEVLNTRFLVGAGYRWSFLPLDEKGVKTAVLSRFPWVRTGFHRPPSEGTSLRSLVEVEIDLGGRPLVVIGNHWKSRIPTPAATEGLRRASATLLSRRIATLEARADRPFVVAVGDFNTAFELSRFRPDRALVPGGTFDGAEAGLVVYASRAGAEDSPWPGAVWDPWDTVTSPAGTYVFQGNWDRLDHAFVATTSLRLPDWAVGAFEARAYAPEPLAWRPRRSDGVSDHFPVLLTLVRRGRDTDSP